MDQHNNKKNGITYLAKVWRAVAMRGGKKWLIKVETEEPKTSDELQRWKDIFYND